MGTQTAVTNDRGLYRFTAVPSGTYKISFELTGFYSFFAMSLPKTPRSIYSL